MRCTSAVSVKSRRLVTRLGNNPAGAELVEVRVPVVVSRRQPFFCADPDA